MFETKQTMLDTGEGIKHSNSDAQVTAVTHHRANAKASNFLSTARLIR